jgi:hypothetical protein
MTQRRNHAPPVIITDEERSVAAGVKHFFERLVHAGEQILNNIWSELKSSLKIRGYVLGRHALKQVHSATELICEEHERRRHKLIGVTPAIDKGFDTRFQAAIHVSR